MTGGITISDVSSSAVEDAPKKKSAGILDRTVQNWLHMLPPDLVQSSTIQLDSLQRGWPNRHVIYQPMLLLSQGTFQTPEWQGLFNAAGGDQVQILFTTMAQALKVTHIAINEPIPAENLTAAGEEVNVLRSPSNLQPLFGDFGPVVASDDPSLSDFDAAFWVSAVQNGIKQVWAPRYTMFSRGNVTEKARILNLPPVTDAVRRGTDDGRGCSAVDLYAGIGYFAFSYVKAGVDKVLCWEINPWSVEGLKRGAESNGWEVRIFKEDDMADLDAIQAAVNDRSVRLLVFHVSNERALETFRGISGAVPPVRHINCGLLPTSRGSWETAVHLVQPEGGWIHLHENIAVADIHARAEEIVLDIQTMYEAGDASAAERDVPGKIELQHVERVKTYAPGVMHCVLDIYICSSKAVALDEG
ncbi:hypothetical protein NA57DRAFT_33587 [Rhizodiscina lignyota]|uniref:tRNA wybutosine-synthesizing protein 2 n=1 Tax=Rhizodiscina lignyota TaxID=1504668 RepID=A0A9P4IL36_9PEZI|nr:hypothetical protein NA57DRAFT_33587 [Rhizodiscina lignyota]